MRHSIVKRAAAFAAAGFVALTLAVPAAAQYYGRNKVQYQNFNFRIMKTRHFDVYFYLQNEDTIKIAAEMAERWYARFARMFNHELKGRQTLILYASSPEFQQTTVIPGQLGEGTGGVTESLKRRIVLPFGATLSETNHVIGHELVHAFQYDIMAQGHSDAYRGNDAGLRIPLWFIEGMAEYLSIGPLDPQTAMWMRDAIQRKALPTIKKMDNQKYFPYRYGHAWWAYMTGRYGDEVVGKLMKAVGRAGSYDAVIEGLLRIKLDQLSKDWQKAMADAYLPLIPMTEPLTKTGTTLVKATEEGFYNISPVISPDGSRMVFLSSRDLFSIDYFLADAHSGKILRRLTSTAVDPHFESIEFIRSAGSWDRTGRRFLFSAVTRGRPVLTIMDVERDRIEREVPFPELAEILNPSMAPDGNAVAFSAVAGGVSDLYIYDLKANQLKQVTKDDFGDIEPAWSPDGRRIAFSTERFSANMNWLDIRNYDLALYDVGSGEITRLPGFPAGNNVNAEWAPDGQSIYFISDQNGKSDLYRIAVADGKITELTNLYTGIAGITEISPAISVSRDKGTLIFSGYDQGRYSIFAIEDPQRLAGQSFLPQFTAQNPAVLPPRTQPEGALEALLKNPMFGLPKDTNFQVTAYKPHLSLDYVTQPQVAVGVDRYGSYGAGGVAAYWTDMLGYYQLVTMLETSNRLIDTSGLVAYINSRRRTNWGAVAQRFSYPYGYYSVTQGDLFGTPVIYELEDIYRQINYDLSGFASYPFSQVQRAEFSLGARYLQFNHTLYTRAYDFNGMLVLNDKTSLPVPKGLALGYGSASLIYDSGIFGATSPILGQSYVVQASPTLGTINYITGYADARKYLMPVRPFTLAFRALHYGRYGGGAEDMRLYPVYIGFWDMVRGYESFTQAEFEKKPFDIGRLYGSKMLVGNVELRFPLLGVLGIGRNFYGAWPLEAFAFYDIGLAWWDKASEPGNPYITSNADPRASFLGGSRKPISSAGFGLRTNVFGYLVVGVNYVYPISRPARGWHFQISISPGF